MNLKILTICTAATSFFLGAINADFPAVQAWRPSVEFLYFVPTIDDTHFVTTSAAGTIAPIGSRRDNDLFFKPGFRVGIAADFCDGLAANISYTWLQAHQGKHISGPSLSALQGSAGFATTFNNYNGSSASHLNTLYERVDALFSQDIWCRCGWNVNMQLGFEYAYLRLREHYAYQSAISLGRVSQLTRTFGFGPEAGFAFAYDLGDLPWLGGMVILDGFSSASLLSGQTRDSNLETIDGVTTLSVDDRRAWRMIPALHARFGISYIRSICNCNTVFSVGYELNTYIRGISRILYPVNSPTARQSFTDYYNFDVQGLYISASCAF